MPVATSADDSKHRPPRPKSGTAALVGLLGIVGVSGTILTLIMRRYSSLILLPPSFKRLQLDEEGVAQLLSEHRFVLMGGPHRGGTTLLWRLIAQHPLVSAFAETADTDYGEGAFLQTVLPRFGVGTEAMRQAMPGAASQPSGLGRYAFAPEAHLTERSHLLSNRTRARLLSEWGYHWNLSRPVLLEKTPTNMVSSRLLQALLAPAQAVRFVFISVRPLSLARSLPRSLPPSLPRSLPPSHTLLRQRCRAAVPRVIDA